jgi:hypothetical protein
VQTFPAVAPFARRLGLVLTVVFAFIAMQTGSACAFEASARECEDDCEDEPADECDDEHAPACAEEHGVPCPPACSDCPGCSGPATAVLRTAEGSPPPRMRHVVLDDVRRQLVAVTDTARIDRPPRA